MAEDFWVFRRSFRGRTETLIDAGKTNYAMSHVHVPQMVGSYSALVLYRRFVDSTND